MSFPLLVLSATSRGEIKVKYLLITAAILLALIIGMKGMIEAYMENVQIITKISKGAEIEVSSSKPDSTEAIMVNISYAKIHETEVIIVSVDDVMSYLTLHKATLRGSPPGHHEALIGCNIRQYLPSDTFSINNVTFNISGIVIANDYLSYSIIISTNSAQLLALNWITVYEWNPSQANDSHEISVAAPSLPNIMNSITIEVRNTLFFISAIIYTMICITSFFLANSASLESQYMFKVLISIGTPLKRLITSLITLATILAILSTIFGLALGIFASSLISATVSIFFKLPYIRPAIYDHLAFDAFLGFTMTFLGFLSGFLRGLMRVASRV